MVSLLSAAALVWLAVWIFVTPNPDRWVTRRLSAPASPVELISILVSARNEEFRVLRPAIESMLAQRGVQLEVVAVDDRSSDRTLEILHSIADARLKVVSGEALPADWVGKTHGMAQALRAARGEWILVTDADILFDPEAVSTAMELCRREQLDVLSLWPRIDCLSFWERVVMPIDLAVTAILFPLDRVNGTRHRDAFTIGGFTLMRRQALESIGAFHAIHRDVADDFALGILLKKAGYRLRMGFSPELLRTRDYTGFSEIWEGLTRKLFSNFIYVPFVRAFRQRFKGVDEWRRRHRQMFLTIIGGGAVTAGMLGLFLVILPFACIKVAPAPALAAYAISCWIHRQYARYCGVAAGYSLLAPLGYALYTSILLVAAWRVLTGRGLIWKGRRIY